MVVNMGINFFFRKYAFLKIISILALESKQHSSLGIHSNTIANQLALYDVFRQIIIAQK